MPRYDRPDSDCQGILNAKLSHYHIINLNERIKTPGKVNRNQEFNYLGLKPEHFANKSVLDVGALDGVIAFNAEKAGATNVLAIDVEDPAMQDWGWQGATRKFANLGNIKNRVFPTLKEFFESNVHRKQMTVYDLAPVVDGMFDIVFFYGVLYHLRHPLLALDKLRAVCSGAICVETHVCNYDPMTPSSVFYLDDVLAKAGSNWSGPSESCVASWMQNAGFTTVYAEQKPRIQSRQRFIGFIDNETFEPDVAHFQRLDADYFAEVRRETASKIKRGNMWKF